MGVGRFFQSLFDSRVCGEEIVATQEKIYERSRRENPHEEPHAHLSRVWLSRVRLHGKNISDPRIQMLALTETLQFACIPHPACARALGLYFLHQERPDIIQQFPQFGQEYARVMKSVEAAAANGTLMSIYSRMNPRTAAELEAL